MAWHPTDCYRQGQTAFLIVVCDSSAFEFVRIRPNGDLGRRKYKQASWT